MTAVRPAAGFAVTLPAVTVVAIGYDEGSYGLSERLTLATVAGWTLAVAILLGLVPRRRLGGPAGIAVAVLAALALWTLASALWAPNVELAIEEFCRTALYALVLAGVAIAGGRVRAWSNGLAIGITGLSLLALASRLFPSIAPQDAVERSIVGLRLSWPVGYWNGLGALVAIGVPLLLAAAARSNAPWRGGSAVAATAAIAATGYLTSSRGALVALALAVCLFLVLTRTWVGVAATVAAAAGTAVCVLVLESSEHLVDGPLGTSEAASQGHRAAPLLALACLAAGVAFAAARTLIPADWSPPRVWRRVSVVGALAAVAVGVMLSDPAQRVRAFAAEPATYSADGYVQSHLLSANGNGRWQLWTSAFDQFRHEPVLGGGAASFGPWWLEHGELSQAVRDAHSLYMQSLAELGLLGFLLTVALVLGGSIVGILRALRTAGGIRTTYAGLTAGFAAFGLSAAIDWIWQVTVAGVVGAALLGLLVRSRHAMEPRSLAVQSRIARALPAAAVAALAGLVLVAVAELAASERAAERGDTSEAASHARLARTLTPWSPRPYLQLALIREVEGDYASAHRFVLRALDRDERDWRTWLIRSRLEVKRGWGDAAAESLERAVALNPRSPVWFGYDVTE